VKVCATLDERLGDFRIAAARGHVERGALFGIAACVHLRYCPDQCADDVAASREVEFVRHVIKGRMAARELRIWVGAESKQQLDDAQIPVRGGVMKQGAAVAAVDVGQCRIGEDCAFDVFEEGWMPGLHHQPQYMGEDGAIAPGCESKCAVCITVSNGGNQLVERALLVPSPGEVGAEWDGRVPRSAAGIDDVAGRFHEEVAKRDANGFVERDIFEGRRHVVHPSLLFPGSDAETQMRFAQAEEPSLLRILGRPAQELRQERGKSVDRAADALAGKERAQHRVPLYAGVERRG